jgi:hypothetical protein
MKQIFLISTIHKELGRCNSLELQKILIRFKPEVVFLEALDSTYTKYDKMRFASFGIDHDKLEIKAIQRFILEGSIKYIPVLDQGLSEGFESKYNLVCQIPEFQRHLDKFNSIASNNGFSFLNSPEAILLQNQMRILDSQLLNDSEKQKIVEDDIDAYENDMIKNIVIFCKKNLFQNAVFMCGVAHRESIILKIKNNKEMQDLELNWSFPSDF